MPAHYTATIQTVTPGTAGHMGTFAFDRPEHLAGLLDYDCPNAAPLLVSFRFLVECAKARKACGVVGRTGRTFYFDWVSDDARARPGH